MFRDTGLTVTDSERVVVNVPKYLRDLAAKLAITPIRTVANYILWRKAKWAASALGQDFRSSTDDYLRVSYIHNLAIKYVLSLMYARL